MTGAEFSGVDLDLLADYVGGALDGTPDEAVVAGLIADDPAWREAHQLISGGSGTVTTHLRALGAPDEPMPADVFARIDAALQEATADAAVGRRGMGSSSAEPGLATVIPLRQSPAAGEPGSDGAAVDAQPVAVASERQGKRARRLRWAAPVGIAAGVLAFAGFGIQWISDGSSSDMETSSAAGSAADRAAAPPANGESAERALTTGSNYTRETLAQAGNPALLDQGSRTGSRNKSAPSADTFIAPSADTPPADQDEALSRLRLPEALRACLDAITAENGAGTITTQVLEFARYAGNPALIVQFTAAGGAWVWAAGPDCGEPGVGADKLASVKVG